MADEKKGINFTVGIQVGISEGLAKIFERVADSISNYRKRIRDAENNRWDQIYLTLDEVKKLTDTHYDAVIDVVTPISESDDFLTTYQRFKFLVNNKDFPDAYGEFKGTLLTAYKHWGEFKKDPTKADLREVIGEIVKFQAAVFMRQYRDDKGNMIGDPTDSLKVADAFLELKKMYEIYSTRDQNPINKETYANKEIKWQEIKRLYLPSWVRPLIASGDLKELQQHHTDKDIINFVKVWCNAWQRYIQNQLYIEGRLTYRIERLKADRLN